MTSTNDERAATAVDRKIGQTVRARRLEIGMSQELLAELLGVTFQQVQKYEKGVNRIAASRLWDIARALERDVSWFYPPASGALEPADKLIETRSGLQLRRLLADAHEADQEIIVAAALGAAEALVRRRNRRAGKVPG